MPASPGSRPCWPGRCGPWPCSAWPPQCLPAGVLLHPLRTGRRPGALPAADYLAGFANGAVFLYLSLAALALLVSLTALVIEDSDGVVFQAALGVCVMALPLATGALWLRLQGLTTATDRTAAPTLDGRKE